MFIGRDVLEVPMACFDDTADSVPVLYEEDIADAADALSSMLEPFDEGAAVAYLRGREPKHPADAELADLIERRGVLAVSLGKFSELCAAQGVRPVISLVGGHREGSAPVGAERGGSVGALYAGYEFLISMAQSPELPEGAAAGCEAMAWMLYEAAERVCDAGAAEPERGRA